MEVAEFLAVKYPFGREHEASVQLLFRSFCNLLRIGDQFELARASVGHLHEQRSFLKVQVVDVFFKALNWWCKSENSIHPLTWPTYIEYAHLQDHKAQVDEVAKSLQFKLLLVHLCKDCDAEILKELYAFERVTRPQLSLQCQAYLTSILTTSTSLAILLLNSLPLDKVSFQMNNIVLDAIDGCVHQPERKKSLYELLAGARVDFATDGAKDRLEVILGDIFGVCQRPKDSAHHLSLNDVFAACASREDVELYSLAQKVFHDSQDAAARHRHKWRELALQTASTQTHFFDAMLLKAHKLMKEHGYPQLVELFDTPEWRPLLPVVFHRAWRQCRDSEQSHRVITAFLKVKDEKMKALINRHQRIDIIEQCLNLNSPGRRLASSEVMTVPKAHSILHTLLICLDDLHSWDHQRMMKTLTAESAYALLDHRENEVRDGKSLSVRQQRDINIFNAFYIIDCVMQALTKAAEENVSTKPSRRYTEGVLPLLSTAKKLLQNLRPLPLKLEVLENIFLLLFARSSDRKDDSVSAPAKTEVHNQFKESFIPSEDDVYYTAQEWITPVKLHRHEPVISVGRKLEGTDGDSSAGQTASASGRTTASHQNATVGFLAGDLIVRDILQMVKAAFTDITAAHFETMNHPLLKKVEDDLMALKTSSISEASFMMRLSQLQHRVNEAMWRYQLIIQDGKESGGVSPRPSSDKVHSDDGYAAYERSLLVSTSKPSANHKPAEFGSHESEHSSEFFTNSSGAGPQQNTHKAKRYRKRLNHEKLMSTQAVDGLIPRMFSSPVSLLNRCINRQAYHQANELIKLYGLEESVEGKSFTFGRLYSNDFKQTPVMSSRPNKVKGSAENKSLLLIRQTAANSLNTMDESSRAEQLALSAVLPAVNLDDTQVGRFVGSSCAGNKTATVMVLVDLACSSTGDSHISSQLLNLAQKYMNNSSQDRKPTTAGLCSWLKKCVAVGENARLLEEAKLRHLFLRGNHDISTRSCLLSNLLCMDSSQLKERLGPLVNICSCVETNITPALNENMTTMTSFPADALLRILNKHFTDKQYLTCLMEQIQLLQDTVSSNCSTDVNCTHAAVLKDGPTMIMGRLMFEQGVEPAKLKSVARDMKLNLTHVIIRSCCAPVMCKPLEDSPAVSKFDPRRHIFGYRNILNSVDAGSENFDLSPLQVVSEALQLLLKLVNEVLSAAGAECLDRQLASEITDHEDYGLFCERCALLQQVDLEQLKTDGAKRAFFVNVHNLLSLHGLVDMMASLRAPQRLSSSLSDNLAFQMRTSYLIGQLGVCSVVELQQMFLGVDRLKYLALSSDHPWFSYAPEHKPLTAFALYDGTVNVLPVKCLSAAAVDDEIDDAVTNYMRQAVLISPHTLQVMVPELLTRVHSQIAKDTEPMTGKYDLADVLVWILGYQPATRWSEIKLIMDKLEQQHLLSTLNSPRGDTSNRSFLTRTASSASLASTISVKPEPSSSHLQAIVSVLPARYKLGFSLSAKAGSADVGGDSVDVLPGEQPDFSRSDSVLRHAKFDISNVAVQYLREQSPVVAMLLDILYENMHLENEGEKHFNSQVLNSDYKHLHRYLEKHIVPLCVYIDEEINSLEQLAKIELPHHVKSAFLTHGSFNYMEEASKRCIDALLLDDKYALAVKVIDKLLAVSSTDAHELSALRDFAITQGAAERVSSESITLIKSLSCARLQAHIAVYSLGKSRWPIDRCIQLLNHCERRLWEAKDVTFTPHLAEISKKMSMFYKIMLHAQAKQDMPVFGCSAKVKQMLASNWQSVGQLLTYHPSEVASLLFDAEEFEFAKQLIDMRRAEDDDDLHLKLLVYERYIVWALDTGHAGKSEMYQVLSECLSLDINWCYKLCVRVLNDLHKPSSMFVIIHFMLEKLIGFLGDKQKTHVWLCHVGAKMLRELDEDKQEKYRHLLSQPLFILEQLLMNCKVSVAEGLMSLLYSPDHDLDFNAEVNELLVTYASKAVHFPVLNVKSSVDGGTESRVSSILGRSMVLSDSLAVSPNTAASSLPKNSPVGPKLPRVTTAPGSLLASSRDATPPSIFSPRLASPLPEKVKSRGSLPERAPDKTEWVPDEQADKCMICHMEKFSMFTRRHHCRRCGRVVCASCSSGTAPVGGRSVRVCDECYDNMFKSSTTNSPSARAKKVKDKTRTAPSSGSSRRSTLVSYEANAGCEPLEWTLGSEESQNEELREEFFYDHAPSVALCTSILGLYGDAQECGRHMLSLCEKLSTIIKPIHSSDINQEVDYNLVISMMQYLLLNAKLKFVEVHDTDGVAMCEAYNNRVDILNHLISNCYLNLPSLEDLSKIDNIRRLRDRLMEDERPELALEISTVFGLGATVVWSTWGIDYLRKGDYPGARAKFLKFLKPLADKHTQTVPYKSILSDIVATLMATQDSASYTQQSVESALKALISGQDISKSVPQLGSTSGKKEDKMAEVEESLYYLNTFGNHQMVVNFFMSHSKLSDAVRYCMDKKCPSDLFFEHVFLPSVKNGELSLLLQQLLSADSSLRSFSAYLTGICRYLSRHGQYHTLYQIQLFTKDYLRAAMTCTQVFYLSNAQSYADLVSRSQHLTKALEHYQSYLHPPKADKNQRAAGNIDLAGRMNMSEAEVRKQMTMVKCQLDVSKHLASSKQPAAPLLSLFTSQQERSSLACRVILSGKNVSAGFGLALRITQEFQLGYSKVYTAAAQELGKAKAFSEVTALVACIKESGLYDSDLLDRVILTALQAAQPFKSSQTADWEALMKQLTNNTSKVDAYILCGKLRNAYLLAIQIGSVDMVKRIAEEAVKQGQPAVKNICDKYLKQKTAK